MFWRDGILHHGSSRPGALNYHHEHSGYGEQVVIAARVVCSDLLFDPICQWSCHMTVAPPPRSVTNAYVCSMQVTDFDGMTKAILKNGGQVALEKFAVPGTCWQGYFLDPEGNTFGLFQVDENAK